MVSEQSSLPVQCGSRTNQAKTKSLIKLCEVCNFLFKKKGIMICER